MSYAIETQRLSKSYGPVAAVRGVDLHIEQGEIYGFLGLNGAGKTTTIRVLLGMVRPTEGEVRVLGQTVGPHGRGPWSQVGYLVETPSAYPDLTVRENLEAARRLHGLKQRATVSAAIEQLGIGAYADRKAGTLSTGNLQRLALARAVQHRPALLVLDEPASGLDPAGVVEIRQLLGGLARQHGVTIFMSSHILTEVDRLATHIGIIHQGRLIEDLDMDQLARFRTRRLEAVVSDPGAALAALSAAGYGDLSNRQGGAICIEDPRAIEAPQEVATVLVHAGVPPARLGVVQQDLEEHFMQLTGGRP